MPSGLPWSEEFIRGLADEDFRQEFVRDRTNVRLALLIRALRDQGERKWSQTELAKRLGTTQSVVSRYEDPDYGKLNLQTLFEIADAFDLPLWVDFPEWDEWLRRIKYIQRDELCRESFDAEALVKQSRNARNAHMDDPTSTDPSPRHSWEPEETFTDGQAIFET